MEYKYYAFDPLCPLSLEIEPIVINKKTQMCVLKPIFHSKTEHLSIYENFIFCFIDSEMKSLNLKTNPFYYTWNELVLLLHTLIKEELYNIYDYIKVETDKRLTKDELLDLVNLFYIYNSKKEILYVNDDKSISETNVRNYIIKITLLKSVDNHSLPITLPSELNSIIEEESTLQVSEIIEDNTN